MKPIFTIHAGEYLVAAQIEKTFKNVNVWLPSKDTGIDLLLTDKSNKKTVSIQVKFSKDFNTTHVKENLRKNIKGIGWWTLYEKKIKGSQADYWVFVLYSIKEKTHDYIIIEPKKLLDIFKKLNRTKTKKDRLDCYFTVTTEGKAFETRGLNKKEMKELYKGAYMNTDRDVTEFLNNWKPIIDKLK
jgi:hypothetical protein